ncbi:hypothetical protein EB796_018160 [Bugula neritina]|uniref:Uncharacterized protein n=1 Tax=Bugula neritina TaxID=10212 RepID=A0A7J7JB77_BUGNE|nr:hypothetical protein EB796_018160 [Bugula neritina]
MNCVIHSRVITFVCVTSSFPVAATSAVVYCATVMTINSLSHAGSVPSLSSTTTCHTTCSPLSPRSPYFLYYKMIYSYCAKYTF